MQRRQKHGPDSQKELTDTADKILKKEKVSYRAKAEVTTCYFPDKRYGDIIFPREITKH